MIKALLSLEENLASCIALRYTSHLNNMLDMVVQTVHVEKSSQKQNPDGTRPVRHALENGLEETGHKTVERLLKTEKVTCTFIEPHKVFIGNPDTEILDELQTGGYDLFLEGNLNTSNVEIFYKRITSRLFSKLMCPVIIVKNLTDRRNAVLLCGEGVDQGKLITQFCKILGKALLDIELLHYTATDNDEVVFLGKNNSRSFLQEAEELLNAHGRIPKRSRVVTGTPDQVSEYLSNYGLVVSAFPTGRSPRMELLAYAPSPLMLCK